MHVSADDGGVPLSIFFAAVRLGKINHWSDRDNACRINFGVRHVVMPLDVIEIHGVGNAWLLIQIHQIPLQVRVIDDAVQIALEMAMINDVESHQRTEKPPVRFDNAMIE